MVVLVAAAVTVISVSVCLRKRKNKHVNTTENVAYHCSSGQETIKINEAYTEIIANDPNYVDETYSYATLPTTAVLTSNAAYNAVSCSGRNEEINLETNDAYDPVNVAENIAYQTSDTADVITSVNEAYIAVESTPFSEESVYESVPDTAECKTDITTSPNQAYAKYT